MRFYVTEKLGPKRSLTPEGFLLCEDVPIARTGTMIYGEVELGGQVKGNADGLVRIVREEDEVFRPEHIASYAGKSFVNDHPNENVTPDNWSSLTAGVVMHPRRGTGMQADLLIADIMVTVPESIKAILADDKIEVSCGYDADYVEVSAGEGKQVNLIGNHVALVDAGRCGPRCAINDHYQGDANMFTKDEQTVGFAQRLGLWMDSVRAAVKSKDETKLNKILDEAPSIPASVTRDDEGGTHIHVHGPGSESEAGPALLHDGRRMSDEDISERFEKEKGERAADMKRVMDGIEEIKKHIGMAQQDAEGEEEKEKEEKKEEAPTGTSDAALAAKDSALFEDSFQRTVAAAEVLAPGLQLPVFNRDALPKATLGAITKLRRTALELAYMTAESRGIIDQVLGGKPLVLDSMSTKDVKMLFAAATAAKKAINNGQSRATGDVQVAGTGGGVGVRGSVKNIADLNKLWADKYKPAA